MSTNDPCCMKPDHPQRRVSYTDPENHCWVFVDVDEGIADLLKALWVRGIRTRYSCQGYPEKKIRARRNAYIMFQTPEDAVRLALFLRPDSEIFVYADGLLEYGKRGVVMNKDSWTWDLNPCVMPSVEWYSKDDPDMSKITHMDLRASVRFPPEHISKILAGLRAEDWPLRGINS